MRIAIILVNFPKEGWMLWISNSLDPWPRWHILQVQPPFSSPQDVQTICPHAILLPVGPQTFFSLA